MGRNDGVELVWPGKYDAEGRRVETPVRPAELRVRERHGMAAPGDDADLLVHGDNLGLLDALTETYRGRVDLVYIDPPFGTGGRFEVQRRLGHGNGDPPLLRLPAYDDAFDGGTAGLLRLLDPRLRRVHELLSPRGSLYVHVDPTQGHAVKLLLDEIFGPECFQREIVWRIGWVSGFKSRARNWVRNHDLIFFYTKDPSEFTFNKQYAPHPEGYRRRDGKPSQAPGVPLEDVWNANEVEHQLRGSESLDSIQIKSFSREKTGWATQKNESLLARIIEASSNPGDLVMDVFAGSGTTAAVARRLGRRFVACDRSASAVQIARARVLEISGARGVAIGEALRPEAGAELGEIAAQLRRLGEYEPSGAPLHGRRGDEGLVVVGPDVGAEELRAWLTTAARLGLRELVVASTRWSRAIPVELEEEEAVKLYLLEVGEGARLSPRVRVSLVREGSAVRVSHALVRAPSWVELAAPLARCEEPLALVESWCVGERDAEGALRVEHVVARDPRTRSLDAGLVVGDRPAAARLYDVLGGVHEWG